MPGVCKDVVTVKSNGSTETRHSGARHERGVQEFACRISSIAAAALISLDSYVPIRQLTANRASTTGRSYLHRVGPVRGIGAPAPEPTAGANAPSYEGPLGDGRAISQVRQADGLVAVAVATALAMPRRTRASCTQFERYFYVRSAIMLTETVIAHWSDGILTEEGYTGTG